MAEIPTHWLHEETLSPSDVGKIFDVSPRTVTRWARTGIIGFFRTPNHVRRFPLCEVKRLMAGAEPEDPQLLIDLAEQDNQKFFEKWQSGWRRGDKAYVRGDADE